MSGRVLGFSTGGTIESFKVASDSPSGLILLNVINVCNTLRQDFKHVHLFHHQYISNLVTVTVSSTVMIVLYMSRAMMSMVFSRKHHHNFFSLISFTNASASAAWHFSSGCLFGLHPTNFGCFGFIYMSDQSCLENSGMALHSFHLVYIL